MNKAVRAGTLRHFVRGRNASMSEGDALVPANKRVKLRPHDVHLKNFAYKNALDAALATREPATVAGVLEELQQRGRQALETALAGRDESELESLLSFCARYVAHPIFAPTLIPVCSHLVSCYASVLGESIAVDGLFTRLAQNVNQEIQVDRELVQLLGQVKMVLGDSN